MYIFCFFFNYNFNVKITLRVFHLPSKDELAYGKTIGYFSNCFMKIFLKNSINSHRYSLRRNTQDFSINTHSKQLRN